MRHAARSGSERHWLAAGFRWIAPRAAGLRECVGPVEAAEPADSACLAVRQLDCPGGFADSVEARALVELIG